MGIVKRRISESNKLEGHGLNRLKGTSKEFGELLELYLEDETDILSIDRLCLADQKVVLPHGSRPNVRARKLIGDISNASWRMPEGFHFGVLQGLTPSYNCRVSLWGSLRAL
jgi:hypothetical protein